VATLSSLSLPAGAVPPSPTLPRSMKITVHRIHTRASSVCLCLDRTGTLCRDRHVSSNAAESLPPGPVVSLQVIVWLEMCFRGFLAKSFGGMP
jgi:hypothetical protein